MCVPILFFYVSIEHLRSNILVDDGIHVTPSLGSCFWRLEKLHATCQMKMHPFMMQNVLYLAKIIQTLNQFSSHSLRVFFLVPLWVCVFMSFLLLFSLHSHFLRGCSFWFLLMLVLLNVHVNIENAPVECSKLTKWTWSVWISIICWKVSFPFHSFTIVVWCLLLFCATSKLYFHNGLQISFSRVTLFEKKHSKTLLVL